MYKKFFKTAEERGQLFKNLFEDSHLGARVMEYLKLKYYNRPTYVPGADVNAALFLEGQRAVIADILRYIEQGKK